MIRATTLCILLLSSLINYAQNKASITIHKKEPIKPLQVGDKVPDVLMQNIRNYKSSTAKLYDFKGKLIILDFWNRYCEPCLRAFPEMDNLQSEFKGKMQILCVTNNSPMEVKKLLDNSPIVKGVKLPFVLGDTVLHTLFPHIGVPFHVWIDSNMIVSQITEGWNTTKGNVTKFLNGQNPSFIERSEASDAALITEPLLSQLFDGGEKQKSQLQSYSLIMKRSQLTAKVGRKFGVADSIINFLNEDIRGLFNAAYLSFPYTGQISIKTIIELKDSNNITKYYPPIDIDKYGNWVEENTYCYELKPPGFIYGLPRKDCDEQKTKIAVQDLERFFNVKSSLEERLVKSLVLYKTSNELDLTTKGEEPLYFVTKENVAVIHNRPISNSIHLILLKYFADYRGPNSMPIIDETNFKGNFDADLKIGKTLAEFDKALNKYGLGVKEEVRRTKCIIIKEN